MKKILLIILMCIAYTTSLGQAPLLGLKAGISTRSEIERVLGRPVRQVSPTLVEYPPKQIKLKAENKSISSGKIYVQYRDSSAAAFAERIETIVCVREGDVFPADCDLPGMHNEFDPADGTFDAYTQIDEPNGFKIVRHMGAPRYMVRTDVARRGANGSGAEVRWAFYSRDLYEAVAPTGNCLGSFWGEWETDRGRMTITRTDVGKFRATYAENNGTVTGVIEGGLNGEWKDSTGSGTMWLRMRPLPGERSFSGSWARTSGTGPRKGEWEGKCIE